MWRAHLLHTLTDDMPHKRWVFITLTAKGVLHRDAKKTLQNLKQGWGKLYDKIRYKWGRAFSYVMLYETHKSGAYHIHALVDLGEEYDVYGPAPSGNTDHKELVKAEKRHGFCKELKRLAVKAKIGYIVHARRINEGDTPGDNVRLAVGYVTKYFLKQVDILDFPKHARRIGTSRDIGSPKTKSKKMFTWRVRSYIHWREAMEKPHLIIAENRILEASDFGDTGMYPEGE